MNPAHRQGEHRVRFDWGPTGALAVAADVAVVVDVLSFTTTVSVAADRGIAVAPQAGHDGLPARARGLSPAAMAELPHVDRIVVPSPNGSAISSALAGTGTRVVAGCLRNRSAVAGALGSGTVAVVAAGERWPDGSLRPCAEDLWGAGAVLALLPPDDLSPEARLAADAFLAVAPRLRDSLRGCAGGLELAARGFAADVEIAAELDGSRAVPVLTEGAFVA